MSPRTVKHDATKGPAKDERDPDWSPARLSDRKLQELKQSLERVRRYGDSFANIKLSDYVAARLGEVDES